MLSFPPPPNNANPNGVALDRVNILLGLYCRYRFAACDGNKELLMRIDNLICEFEWAFPETANLVKKAYANNKEQKATI